MPALYITRAQPNPRGRDTASQGQALNSKLNEEWVEFRADASRNLIGDSLSHLTFSTYGCSPTGRDELVKFGSLQVDAGDLVMVHTGSGTSGWVGRTYHVYLGRRWFIWNNGCGDRAILAYSGQEIDHAYYASNPPEGELVRVAGTDRLEPVGAFSSWR
jgi:hypothetical protein